VTPPATPPRAGRTAAAAIERDGNDALALAIFGHVHSFLRKDYDTAVELLERALRARPNCAMAWTLSSATCGYLGQGATAVLRAEHGLRGADALRIWPRFVIGSPWMHDEADRLGLPEAERTVDGFVAALGGRVTGWLPRA
jgi:hypothetical protein